MERGFVDHANEVERLLVDQRTTFVVVSTLEAAPTHEAHFLAKELLRRDMHLGAIIANRVMPESFMSKASATSARKLVKLAGSGLADEVASQLDVDAEDTEAVLTEIGERFHEVAVVATREAERRAELAVLTPLLVAAPMLDRDVNNVADLLDLASHLTP